MSDLTTEQVGAVAAALGLPVTLDDLAEMTHRLNALIEALEPLAEIQPALQPWRGCADVRRDVTVADLLPAVADQEVLRSTGPEWADR